MIWEEFFRKKHKLILIHLICKYVVEIGIFEMSVNF